MVLDVSDKFCPAQMGELLPGVGAAGIGFTVTKKVDAPLEQLPAIAITE